MLTVRDSQMSALRADTEQRFVEELVAQARVRFPRAGVDEQMVRRVMGAAARYGLETQTDVYLFLSIACEVGEGFRDSTEHGWIHEYLTDSEVRDARTRLRRAYDELVERTRMEDENRRLRKEFFGGR